MQNKSPRNKTIALSPPEEKKWSRLLKEKIDYSNLEQIKNKVLLGDSIKIIQNLPSESIDLLLTDPPYNMTKYYAGTRFSKTNSIEYETWLRSWIEPITRLLKTNASIYICTEWQSSSSVEKVLRDYFFIQNRITWEREKGRAAKQNWKNASEDIWFCTVSKDYTFNNQAVQLKKKVIAPYKTAEGKPKDWQKEGDQKYRLTAPSNLWTDISVPFWSMKENTEHPTQKPEKLIAKLILASSNPGDLILDPFLGSGTTATVAHKLNRNYIGIEKELYYAQLSLKRIEMASEDSQIQGFRDGCFWERNSK